MLAPTRTFATIRESRVIAANALSATRRARHAEVVQARRDGETVHGLAARFRMSRETIRGILDRAGLPRKIFAPVSPETKALIVQALRDGKGPTEIAEELRVSRDRVRTIGREAGIPSKRTNGTAYVGARRRDRCEPRRRRGAPIDGLAWLAPGPRYPAILNVLVTWHRLNGMRAHGHEIARGR